MKEDTRNVIDKYKGWTNEAIKTDLARHSFALHIAIENYQHDFNIGTIVRNANAFNVRSVRIIGKRKWNRRGAMVTDRYLTVEHHSDVVEFQQWAISENLTIIGIDNIPGSVNLNESPLPSNVVLVFGQEGPGLSEEIQKICENIVAIEQFGSTRSVNVGVASGIVMREWVRQNILSKQSK